MRKKEGEREGRRRGTREGERFFSWVKVSKDSVFIVFLFLFF